MAVVAFPKPEPWPNELFDGYGLADLLLRRDVSAVIRRRELSHANHDPAPTSLTAAGTGSQRTEGNA
jgi:hypothetical protein